MPYLDLTRFLALNQIDQAALTELYYDDRVSLHGPFLISDIDHLPRAEIFSYADALTIEVARQIASENHMSLPHAMATVSYVGGIDGFLAYKPDYRFGPTRRSLVDFWMAVVGKRYVTETPLFESETTTFGAGEVAFKAHFTGPLHQIFAEISHSLARDDDDERSHPAYIILANVSTADRRLRKRAAELGIAIEGDDFAAAGPA